jgi:hypothetical protein
MDAYRLLVGKLEGKRRLGKRRIRREYNSKMDLREIICADVDWINVAQYSDQWRALTHMLMNLCVT